MESEESDRESLLRIAAQLEQFPGRERHQLMRFKDDQGNLGMDFSSLDLQIRAMAERLRSAAKTVK